MTTFQIVSLYALFVGIFFFGLWQWRSRESDYVEKAFGFMYVMLSSIAIICFSIGVLTGNV